MDTPTKTTTLHKPEQLLLQHYFIPYYKLVFNCLAEENVSSKFLTSAIPKFLTSYQLWKYLKLPRIITDRIFQKFQHQELHYFGINSFLELFETLIVSSNVQKATFLFNLLQVQDRGHFTLSQCCRVFGALSSCQQSFKGQQSRVNYTFELEKLQCQLQPYFLEANPLTCSNLVELMSSSVDTPFHEVRRKISQIFQFLTSYLRIAERVIEFAAITSLKKIKPSARHEGQLHTSLQELKAKKGHYCTLVDELIICKLFLRDLVFRDKEAIKIHKALYIGQLLRVEVHTLRLKKSKVFALYLTTRKNVVQFYFKDQKQLSLWKKGLIETSNYRQIETSYNLEKLIGEGSHSFVYEGQHKNTGEKVAIKVIDKKYLKTRDFQIIEREREVLSQCSHQNIVKIIDYFECDKRIFIVEELVAGVALKEFLRTSKDSLSQEEVIQICRGVLKGLMHLKLRGIMHRDLKPQNIMLQKLKPVILDFSLSKQYREEELGQEAVGSPFYMAPEIISGSGYSQKVDTYSLGCILYEIVFGRVPFDKKSKHDVFRSLLDQSVDFESPKEPYTSKALIVLIQSKAMLRLEMLAKEADDRPTIEEIQSSLIDII